MSQMRSTFEGLRRKGESALICYLTAGFPSLQESKEHILACIDGGADIMEVGVPFSDPVADGKVIQKASQKALENGMTPLKVLELVSDIRKETEVPILLMGYYNPIFKIGESRFVHIANRAGVDGMIVPDLPLEESTTLGREMDAAGMDLVQLIGPLTSERRMRKIASASKGFVYLVSGLGTTGERRTLDPNIGELIARAKHASNKVPVCVGFGISGKESYRPSARKRSGWSDRWEQVAVHDHGRFLTERNGRYRQDRRSACKMG